MPKIRRTATIHLPILAALIMLIGFDTATAGEYVISQKSRKFTPSVLKGKVGDTVVFLNDDRYAHNIFSETPGHEFDIRKQMPGARHVISLEKRGTFEVRCAIHPRMTMRIVVE